MGVKTSSQITTDINTFLPDNSSELISAQDERDRLLDLNDSTINIVDAGLVVQALLGYTTNLTPSDDKHFTPKKFVEDKISDTAYDATSWNGVTTIAPSKNAVRDKIELLLLLDGSKPMTGDLDMNGNNLLDLDFLFDSTNVNEVISLHSQYLRDDNSELALSWSQATRKLYDQNGDDAIDFSTTRELIGDWTLPAESWLMVSTYGTISETLGGLAYITGNAIRADFAANNQLIKTAADSAQFMKMRYDVGVSFHTNITGASSSTHADTSGEAVRIDLDRELSIIDPSKAFYLGLKTDNGSWRIIQDGLDLAFERREAGVWVQKGIFTA